MSIQRPSSAPGPALSEFRKFLASFQLKPATQFSIASIVQVCGCLGLIIHYHVTTTNPRLPNEKFDGFILNYIQLISTVILVEILTRNKKTINGIIKGRVMIVV